MLAVTSAEARAEGCQRRDRPCCPGSHYRMSGECKSSPILEIEHLRVMIPVRSQKRFLRKASVVHAVDDVSFSLAYGETLGIVGESGCGKTTLLRATVRLLVPSEGSIRIHGVDIARERGRSLRTKRADLQMVFQDPQGSLNPRRRVGIAVADAAKRRGYKGRLLDRRVADLFAQVGLSPEHIHRLPHQFSGGQRQRIGIARALAMEPSVVLLDEPVSALDVSIRAQVINLLEDIQQAAGMSFVFVAHDLSVVRHISDRVVVMYLGKIVEVASGDELYTKAIHPYTRALLDVVPSPDPEASRIRDRVVVQGDPPSSIDPPAGCRFHTRCPVKTIICTEIEPPLTEFEGGHLAACHHPQAVSATEIAGSRRSPLSPLSSGKAPLSARPQA